MTIKELIERAATKAGDQKNLAKVIGVGANTLTDAKAGRRGLPDFACYKLAALLEIDPAQVVAASALVTEKDPEKRAVFLPFVNGRQAAGIAIAALIGSTAPMQDAYANDTFKVSPRYETRASTASAGNATGIMPIIRRFVSRIIDLVRSSFAGETLHCGCAG